MAHEAEKFIAGAETGIGLMGLAFLSGQAAARRRQQEAQSAAAEWARYRANAVVLEKIKADCADASASLDRIHAAKMRILAVRRRQLGLTSG